MNLAARVLAALVSAGVREVVVCPGGRNAEFVDLLSGHSELAVTWHFEERSAAFWALGRAVASSRPVAVITTSGTAAGELLPAVMEAHYSGVPLVVVTADRPRRFRGSGAPQSAEQGGLFASYAVWETDLEAEDLIEMPSNFEGPIHLNVCLEDPNGAASSAPALAYESLESFLDSVSRPLVVVGRLAPEERAEAADLIKQLGAPVYLEGLSGLRGMPDLEAISIRVCDQIFSRAAKFGWEIDGLLRIGGVPTHRLWRDLEDRLAHIPVFNISRQPFTGLSRPSGISSRYSWAQHRGFPKELKKEDDGLAAGLARLMDQEPESEPALVRRISRSVGDGARVFLGNSLPVREWDLAADWRAGLEKGASRGLNGIDGQVSAFLGWARPESENWAVLGDLTLLYDLAGFWAKGGVTGTVCVINNSGGRIFERMFGNPSFLNAHELSFEPVAKLWGLDYELNPETLTASMAGIKLVELRPDPEATSRFWQRYGELLS